MSLCPESKQRSEMTDAEFWEHVLQPGQGPDYEFDVPDEIQMAELHLTEPCLECGATGACGYDAEGRPMIHAIDADGPTA